MSGAVLTAGELRSLATRMLVALGTPEDLAGVVAESLLNANLAGHDSHGLVRLPAYADSVRRGKVRPDQRALVVSIRGATGRVCARWGWGQPAGACRCGAAGGGGGTGGCVLRSHGALLVDEFQSHERRADQASRCT